MIFILIILALTSLYEAMYIKKLKDRSQGIAIKNINLSKCNLLDQYKKVDEEILELEDAMENADFEGTKEEFWDVVQVFVGLVFKATGITAKELMNYYPKHLEKIKNRPRRKPATINQEFEDAIKDMVAKDNRFIQRFTRKE